MNSAEKRMVKFTAKKSLNEITLSFSGGWRCLRLRSRRKRRDKSRKKKKFGAKLETCSASFRLPFFAARTSSQPLRWILKQISWIIDGRGSKKAMNFLRTLNFHANFMTQSSMDLRNLRIERTFQRIFKANE